jgi:hypothetical protein
MATWKIGAAFALGVASAWGVSVVAGDLQPPAGPVTPTFKTLDEVEPSTPIESLPGDATARHVITQRGAYHLTGNMNAAFAGEILIEVATSGVTIDLRGFTLGASNISDHVILDVSSGGADGLTVRNGRMQATSDEAIFAPSAGQCLIESISFSGADALGGDAVVVGDGSIVRDIRAVSGGGVVVGNNSVVQRVTNVSGRETVKAGDGSVVSDITIDGINGGAANRLIQVGDGCTIERVRARDARNRGIAAGSHATIRDCSFVNHGGPDFDAGSNTVVASGDSSIVERVTIEFWGDTGISVGTESVVRDCVMVGPGENSTGISMGGGSLVEGCSVRDYELGISVFGSRVRSCYVFNSLNIGILAGSESIVEGCQVVASGVNAITASFGTVIRGNVLRDNAGGIVVGGDTRVENNQLDGDQIRVTGPDNVIDGNVITDLSLDAIFVSNVGNTITRNRLSAGAAGYNIIAGNSVGTIRTSPVGADAWDNFDF